MVSGELYCVWISPIFEWSAVDLDAASLCGNVCSWWCELEMPLIAIEYRWGLSTLISCSNDEAWLPSRCHCGYAKQIKLLIPNSLEYVEQQTTTNYYEEANSRCLIRPVVWMILVGCDFSSPTLKYCSDLEWFDVQSLVTFCLVQLGNQACSQYHEDFDESDVQVCCLFGSGVHLAWSVFRFRGAFKVWRLEDEFLCWCFVLAWSIWYRVHTLLERVCS